ncbi:MAG TPA: hypothetical protein PK079_18705 [Leptospiraceae bacterium]|nr:hypothetical protein [Leptospiraceae bacterium]HMW06703.1 hypothetical protein [Leptospiraceae bacterium]HMX31953.1 hypothetical protein [Leptospiraceae bacterium]HMY33624.1 hypothetical protein [Leptospiraceae bacterium]HMZ66456.1 hypothetical protein [Leptospiraceae bacterium]
MQTVSIEYIQEFKKDNSISLRGEKFKQMKSSVDEFKKRFKQRGQVEAVRTIDLISAAYPLSFAYAGAAIGINPYVNIVNRLVLVKYKDFNGKSRILAWEPTIREGSANSPFYRQLLDFYGEFLSYKILTTQYNTLFTALAKAGLTSDQIDYVTFDHLHVQDLRYLMGTTKPIQGEAENRKPFFPNAKFIFQKKEMDTLRSPHPMQWAWYVTECTENLDEKNLILIDGDVELGYGIALIATPGHTDGNHSLCINTPDGIWVSSENGVSLDSWFPEYSKIPGIRSYSKFYNREVILNSNTLEDSIEQYDSMVKEKLLADVNRKYPKLKNIQPSSEVGRFYRHFPVIPTFQMGGMNYGKLI